MSELPEEVSDLRQERINTLRLIFAEVPEIERKAIVRQALELCVVSAKTAADLERYVDHAYKALERIDLTLDADAGAFPMGALAGRALRSELARTRDMVAYALEMTRWIR